jgi:DNA-binding transcriptional MerR regulator
VSRVSIGRFARLSGLTIKAPRHSAELKLLEAREVDPETGYRYYGLDQVEGVVRVRTLRGLDLPLDEIHVLLGDPDAGAERLKAHRERLRVPAGYRTELQVPI